VTTANTPESFRDYYGFYSNKKRGMQEKTMPNAEQALGMPQLDTPFRRECSMVFFELHLILLLP
jgi:hypothetical protein